MTDRIMRIAVVTLENIAVDFLSFLAVAKKLVESLQRVSERWDSCKRNLELFGGGVCFVLCPPNEGSTRDICQKDKADDRKLLFYVSYLNSLLWMSPKNVVFCLGNDQLGSFVFVYDSVWKWNRFWVAVGWQHQCKSHFVCPSGLNQKCFMNNEVSGFPFVPGIKTLFFEEWNRAVISMNPDRL